MSTTPVDRIYAALDSYADYCEAQMSCSCSAAKGSSLAESREERRLRFYEELDTFAGFLERAQLELAREKASGAA